MCATGHPRHTRVHIYLQLFLQYALFYDGVPHQYAGVGATGHIHGLRSLEATLLSCYLRLFCVFRATYLRLVTSDE